MTALPRLQGTRRRAAALAAVALVVAAVSACSNDDGRTLPPPSETTSTTSTTVPIDYSEVSLPAINPGNPPPVTRPTVPGEASIAGRVLEERGTVVPGALVRAIYYLDPNSPEVIETLSAEDGSYRFDQLHGGRWRLRAWQEPRFATGESHTFFLGATEKKALDLKVKVVPDLSVTATVAPDPPLVDWPSQLAVLVVNQAVNSEGRVERSPAADVEVTLAPEGRWTLSGPATRRTDDAGTARWTLSCGGEGTQAITAYVFDREFPLTAPSCLSPASTTTTTLVPPDEAPAATTTTTRPRSTTTTRAPSIPAVDPPLRSG